MKHLDRVDLVQHLQLIHYHPVIASLINSEASGAELADDCLGVVATQLEWRVISDEQFVNETSLRYHVFGVARVVRNAQHIRQLSVTSDTAPAVGFAGQHHSAERLSEVQFDHCLVGFAHKHYIHFRRRPLTTDQRLVGGATPDWTQRQSTQIMPIIRRFAGRVLSLGQCLRNND